MSGEVDFAPVDVGLADLAILTDRAIPLDSQLPMDLVDCPFISIAPSPIGVCATKVVVNIANNCNVQQSITALVIAGPDQGDFTVVNTVNLPVSLAPATGFAVEVAFMPNQGGTRSATFTAVAADQNASRTVPLFGGPGPTLSLDVGNLSFGNIKVGAMSPAATITLSNQAVCGLHLGAFQVGGANAGDFVVDTTNTKSIVPGQGSTTFQVAFKPAQVGQRNGSVTINSDDPNGTHIVNLVGNGN